MKLSGQQYGEPHHNLTQCPFSRNGPLGAALGSLFPTAVRYTGASLTFNLAGIVGASLTPYVAKWLADNYGLATVGWYLSASGLVTLAALLMLSRASMAARH